MLAQLASEGTAGLHAPISRSVPELDGRRVGTATLHQLLTNSAGWAEWANPFGTTDEGAPARIFPFVSDTLVLLEPGRVYSYSNPGFSIAGYVAERVMQAPFADLSERMVLRKLGMPRATFRSLVAMTRDFALGHMIDSAGAATVVRPMPTNAAEYPAGFDADHQWAGGGERTHEQQEQETTGGARRPHGAAEHAVVAAEAALAREAQDTQHARDGPYAGREDGAEEKGAGMPPGPLAEERRERYEHGDEAGRQRRHESPLWPEGCLSLQGRPLRYVMSSPPSNGQSRA
jgi:CubicO group peptidase (beta-lactamase class C family)